MLPEVISNGLASLQPGRVRYTKTAMIEFTGDGARAWPSICIPGRSAAGTASRMKRSTIIWPTQKSGGNTSGRGLRAGRPDARAGDDAAGPTLQTRLAGIVARLGEGRSRQERPRHRADREQNSESHQIIEEFMLAANEAVADSLAEADLHFLRRVHHAPDPRRLKALTDFVKELGYQPESLESRFEIQRLLKEVAEKPERQAVNYAILRSLAQAVYSPEVEGHYALASDCYCHFTSPIRRYPDLTIHRLIDGILKKKKPRNDLTELVVLGQHCSDRERRAESAERELTKIKLLDYLGQRIGEELDAVVTGVEEYGLFAQGIALPAEGMIHVSSLADDYYSFDRRTHSLSGRLSGNSFRLGDKIRVAVARVDVDRRELDLRVVTRRSRPRHRPTET